MYKARVSSIHSIWEQTENDSNFSGFFFFFFCLSLFLITHILKQLDCYIVHYSQLLFMHVSFTVIENCFKKRKKHPVILVFFSKKHWNCFLSCLLIHIFFSSMSQCLLVEKNATNGIVKFLDFCFLILHDLSILVDIHSFAFTYFIYWQRGFEKHTVLLRKDLTIFLTWRTLRRLNMTEKLF